jgi:hypothetical protein
MMLASTVAYRAQLYGCLDVPNPGRHDVHVDHTVLGSWPWSDWIHLSDVCHNNGGALDRFGSPVAHALRLCMCSVFLILQVTTSNALVHTDMMPKFYGTFGMIFPFHHAVEGMRFIDFDGACCSRIGFNVLVCPHHADAFTYNSHALNWHLLFGLFGLLLATSGAMCLLFIILCIHIHSVEGAHHSCVARCTKRQLARGSQHQQHWIAIEFGVYNWSLMRFARLFHTPPRPYLSLVMYQYDFVISIKQPSVAQEAS